MRLVGGEGPRVCESGDDGGYIGYGSDGKDYLFPCVTRRDMSACRVR